MDKQELREALDRAFWIDRMYFRSFGLLDWLGLGGFSDKELEELNRLWLAFQGEGDFESWLSHHDAAAHEHYKERLDTVWKALRRYTNIAENLSISGLSHARQQLKY